MPCSSLSRNNRDKSLPKGGSGRHNWGSIGDETELEAGAEYDGELEIEEGPLAPNRWTGGVEPISVDDEDDEEGQRKRRAAAQSDTEGGYIVIPCTCPDAFVVTLGHMAKATQHGKAQDTAPIGSGVYVSAIAPRVLSDALASRPPSIPPRSASRACL